MSKNCVGIYIVNYCKFIRRQIVITIGICYEKGQDYFLGMDFFERIPLVKYQPSKLYEVKKVLKNIPTINRNFLDIGSGKGAVLYLATKFDFFNIYGVEHNEFLYLTSIKNLDSLNDKRIKIIHNNIFNIQNELIDSVDIYYLFNPFDNHLQMKELLELIIKSFYRVKRRIDIIYTCSSYDYIFDEYDIIKEVDIYNFFVSYQPTKHYLIE